MLDRPKSHPHVVALCVFELCGRHPLQSATVHHKAIPTITHAEARSEASFPSPVRVLKISYLTWRACFMSFESPYLVVAYILLLFSDFSPYEIGRKMAKPTVVCVPGAWHTPEIYDQVMNILDSHGYPTISLSLPSVGANPPKPDFADDVMAITTCLTSLVSEEKEVILVMHSYTGMPGTEAPIGLGKKERMTKGLKSGVIRIVYIMAYAMTEGFQPTASDAQFPGWMKPDLAVSRFLKLNSLCIRWLILMAFRTGSSLLSPEVQKAYSIMTHLQRRATDEHQSFYLRV